MDPSSAKIPEERPEEKLETIADQNPAQLHDEQQQEEERASKDLREVQEVQEVLSLLAKRDAFRSSRQYGEADQIRKVCACVCFCCNYRCEK